MTAVFKELGFWQKRSLSRMLEERVVTTGEELMAQGEAGTEFMVLLEGQAAVTVDGEQVKTMRAGDFFGELALLPEISKSDGRRMASVTVTTPATVGVCGPMIFKHIIDSYPRVGGRIIAQAWSITSG